MPIMSGAQSIMAQTGYAPAPSTPALPSPAGPRGGGGGLRLGGTSFAGGGAPGGGFTPRGLLLPQQATSYTGSPTQNAGRTGGPRTPATPSPMPEFSPFEGGGEGVPIETPETSLPQLSAGLMSAAGERGGVGFIEKPAPGLAMALGQRIPPRFTPALSVLGRKAY